MKPKIQTRCSPFACLLLTTLMLPPPATEAATIRVSPTGSDAASGDSWATAKRTPAAALTAAQTGDEIWVAAGTYAGAIQLKDGVAVYGGFAGSETALSQRDWRSRITVLDGTNGVPVVTTPTAVGPGARLDGFTIMRGWGIHGGGLKLVGSAPVIANNCIVSNRTDGAGAGISIWGFLPLGGSGAIHPVLTNNLICRNRSVNDEGDGGGIAVINGSPLIALNVIRENEATRNGGGICCWRSSSPLIFNNRITANSSGVPPNPRTDDLTVTTGGGGIFASATDLDGRPIDDAFSAPFIANNVIDANGAAKGAGLCLIDSIRSDLGVARAINNTIVANSGGGVFWSHCTVVLENNLVAFNSAGLHQRQTIYTSFTNRHNCVFGNRVAARNTDYLDLPDLTGQDGNISADPLLILEKGDGHLLPGSPCVDTGNSEHVLADWKDLDLNPRMHGTSVDIGADEFDGTVYVVHPVVIRVSPVGNDASDGSSWALAMRSIPAALARVGTAGGGELWLMEGTYSNGFILPAYVRMYGGFAGTELTGDQRDPAAHRTVLDGSQVGTVVFSANGGYLISSIEGCVIQNGGVFTGGIPGVLGQEGLGGGVYCRISSPRLHHNVIRSNSFGNPFNAYYARGGAIAAVLAHPFITQNIITNNEILAMDGAGGAIYLNQSLATIEGNQIRDNHAKYGPGIYAINASPLIRSNRVESNHMYVMMPLYFGAVDGAVTLSLCSNAVVEANIIRSNTAANGAGLNVQSCFSARVVNNLIARNLSFDPSSGGAGLGGGVYCITTAASPDNILIANNTIIHNVASGGIFGEMGGGMAVTLATPGLQVANNIVTGNSSGIWRHPTSPAAALFLNNCLFNTNQNYINLTAATGDVVADSRLVDPVNGDYRLQSNSPCVDAGTVSLSPDVDADGIQRPLDGNDDGTPAPDIGAWEFVHPTADTDHDGMADAGECVAGTDPCDPVSVFRLQSTAFGGVEFTLSWMSAPGRKYAVLGAKGGELGTGWDTFATDLPGTGAMMEFKTNLAVLHRFFKVEVGR